MTTTAAVDKATPTTCDECQIVGIPDIDPHTGRITYRDQKVRPCPRHAAQSAAVDALVDSVRVLLSNWPTHRDGMDYKELPAGLQSTRAALAQLEELKGATS